MKLTYPTALVLAAALAAALCGHAWAVLGTLLGAAALTLCGVALAALYAATRTAHATGRYPAKRKGLAALVLALCLTLGLLPALGGTAYADNTETLLTTITPTGAEQASYSTENIATVSFSYLPNTSTATYRTDYTASWGWWGYGWTATVTPADGYTITKCVFYDNANRTATDSSAPFIVETTAGDKTPQVNGTPILANQSKGITKIEVYGYATPATVADYTVTSADMSPDPGTGVKHRNGDEFTIAVTVSGGAFEGGEFTLTYDKDMFQLKMESVAPGKNDDKAINAATGNKFNAESDGQYAFKLNNGVSFTDGDSLVNLTFTVVGNVSAETDYSFAFQNNTASVCYGLNNDTVTATVTDATVTVEPSSFDVTLTGQNGVTFVKDSATITSDTAAYGTDYTVKIGDYSALRYAYTVTLTVGGTEVTDAPSPATDGTITIPAASVTGAIVLTVSRAAKFTVTITPNYVTGYSLITVAKTEANTEDTTYAYGETAMYYVNAYGAYACIVSGAVEQSAAENAVKVGTASAGTITNGETDTTKYDVNGTGKTDYSDALLTYRCYVKAYQTPDTAMETYLRADVNGDKKADTTDVSAVDGNRTPETT